MSEKDIVAFKFAGKEFEADSQAAVSWSVIKGMVTGGREMFAAFDRLFAGKADEYAEDLGDDMEEMARLASAAIEAAKGKNS